MDPMRQPGAVRNLLTRWMTTRHHMGLELTDFGASNTNAGFDDDCSRYLPLEIPRSLASISSHSRRALSCPFSSFAELGVGGACGCRTASHRDAVAR